MKITNTQNLPQPIVDGIQRTRDEYSDSYGGRVADISVTSLIAPPQIRVLSKAHRDEMTEDASDMLWAFFGTAIHSYLEFATSSGIAEKRIFYTDISLDMTLAGQFDLLENGILYDYKLTSMWAVINGVKPEWEAQLNCLAFLCAHDDLDVNALKIVAMLRDWSEMKTRFDQQMPQHQIITIPVKLWTRQEQEAYIKERMSLHHRAEHHGDIPECTDDERWASPAKFAVMKEGRKSAVRLLDSETEANEYMKAITAKGNYSIVERPKEYKRCQQYCNCLPWCPQAKDIYENREVK